VGNAADFTAKVCDTGVGGAHEGFDWSAWLGSNAATAFNTPVLTPAVDAAAGGDPAVALHAAVVSATAAAAVADAAAAAAAAVSPSSNSSSGGVGRRLLAEDLIPWTATECVASLTAAFAAGKHSAGRVGYHFTLALFCSFKTRFN
jgi:hypothetical protein